MDTIEIQKVTANETLFIRQLVLWPDKSADFVKVPEDEAGFHFGLSVNAQLVSVISLFVEEKSMRFRKFATLPEFQGKGLGTRLLEHSIEFARQHQFLRMWCDARTDALGFYERCGFTKFSEPFFKEDIEYYKIEKAL